MQHRMLVAFCVTLLIFFGAVSVGIAAPDTSLTGEWVDGTGTVFSFVASGTDTYSGEIVANPAMVYCLPIDISVSGTGTVYTGTEAFYSLPCQTQVGGSPGASIGSGSATIDVAADGDTAEFTSAPPGGGGCSNCGAVMWTRTGGAPAQTINFTAPSTGAVNGSAALTASASSGLAVVLSIDASTTNGACALAGDTVMYDHAGSCVLDANQGGDSDYAAAPQVQQTIVVVSTASRLSPPANITPPVITGTPKAGKVLTCSTGTWKNDPTSFAFRWIRNGTTLDDATGDTYPVGTLDEGTTLTCAVIATNAAGQASATSKSLKVPIPHVVRCPGATGKMTGTQIGQIKLGMTRGRARYVYRQHSNRGRQYEDFFCLTPIGVRAGYASPKLLKGLSKREQATLSGRVVWSSTSDPYYSLDRIRPGEAIATASAVLGTEPPFHIGLNYWYLARKATYTAVLKVRGGVVEELGIANNKLTTSRRLQSVLMHSFY
jgi:hypothetical protein